jgi:hypothetical protein
MVPIAFDKPRHLKFTLSAIKDMEANLGGQPLGAVMSLLGQVGITAITVALWAGLKHEDKTLTPSLVTKMLSDYIEKGGRTKPLIDALSAALDETHIFKTDDDEDREGNAPAA